MPPRRKPPGTPNDVTPSPVNRPLWSAIPRMMPQRRRRADSNLPPPLMAIGTLVQSVRDHGCLTSATPFDEASVEMCEEFDLDLIKLASSDINDWFLIERVAKTRKPVSFSTGGSSLKDVDDLVKFFSNRAIP